MQQKRVPDFFGFVSASINARCFEGSVLLTGTTEVLTGISLFSVNGLVAFTRHKLHTVPKIAETYCGLRAGG